MTRRLLSLMLACAALLALAPQALAYSYQDNYPEYVVESYQPNGYCYLYDKPSDVKGRNLGRHENGEIVKVISFDQKGYYYVICPNGKVGYMHDYCLTPYNEVLQRTRYRVYSIDPEGYCYLYDRPDDIWGNILEKYDNGEYIQIVEWGLETDPFAQVYCERTKQHGYIRKTALVKQEDYKPLDFYALVDSTDPYGYCYLYSEPSDIYGYNRGRHNNGEWVRVVDWEASEVYAFVECPLDKKMGYMRKTCLKPL